MRPVTRRPSRTIWGFGYTLARCLLYLSSLMMGRSSRSGPPFPRPGWLPLPSHNSCEEPVRALFFCPRVIAATRRDPPGESKFSVGEHAFPAGGTVHSPSDGGMMAARQSGQRVSRTRKETPLLPHPKQRRARPGFFQLEAGTPILLPADGGVLDRRLLLAAEAARDALSKRCGLDLCIERPRADVEGTGRFAIRCALDPSAAIARRLPTARDAYRLVVRKSGVEISAPAVDGLRHGLQTLGQLVDARGRISAVEILDQPDFRDRGVMLDVSRGKVPTRRTLEALVDLCSKLRLNVLMFYVEHTFAFRAHPEIGEGASPLDAETLLALDAYASDRGVELVPCLQSLGHMERVLSLERYAKLAESDRLWSVSPSRPETYRFLEELYDEFLPLFRSRRFNANCDEPFDLGRGQSAARAPDKTPGRLFTDHVSQLERLAARHGKQLMIWADFALKHPDQIERIGRDVVLLDWWYESTFDFDRIRRLRRKGFEVWACPGTSSWNCLFPRIENSCENISRWAEAGRRHGATGLLNTDWGDFGHYNALGVSLHGYAWGAQQAWSGDRDDGDFDRAFSALVFGSDDARIGRLYRRLGAIHDAGFAIANGSALQYLYFDPIDRSFFLQHGRRRALETSRRKLERVQREIRGLALSQAQDDFIGLARQEIVWAADAVGLSIEKSLAALDYNAWREDPSTLRAAERRRLARRLDALADQQADQLVSLERLWLARSEISEFRMTRKRLRKSVTSLRGAARRLRENRPARPVRKTEMTMLEVFNEVRRATGMSPR